MEEDKKKEYNFQRSFSEMVTTQRTKSSENYTKKKTQNKKILCLGTEINI